MAVKHRLCMIQRDYYEVLGVSRSANGDAIRQSYRKLAMLYHPDRNPGDDEAAIKFREAAEAYEVLRDPEKRARYDRFGHAGVQGSAGGGFGNPEDIFAHFSDIFGDLFGFSNANMGPRAEAGADLRHDITISFKQAAHGDEVTITLPKHETCPECKGSGAAVDATVETCRQCRGTGQIRRSQGFFQIAMPCPECHGTGQKITRPCPRCRGVGLVENTRELSVKIPAGVDTGTRLRVRNEGEPGLNGGPAGDLYVVITVEPDYRWRRDGANLIYRQEISFVQAALGHTAEIPGIDTPIPLDIPAGTQSGEVLRIRGEGLPYPGRRERGDMLVQIQVKTPRNLNERQEELLREFEAAGDLGAFDKIKEAGRKIAKAIGLD